MWLNAGAVTLGLGAAMVAGAAVASADAGADAGPSAGHSASSAARSHTASSARSASARGAAAKSTASARSAAAATPAHPAAARRIPGATPFAAVPTPSATALAAASTTTVANARSVALATPTPNNILNSLAEFGTNVYLTVADQVTGIQNNLAVLGEDLQTVLGISRETITPPAPYGDPTLNKQYYVPMTDYAQAALATVAMAYGQLTGAAPDLQGFTTAALDTNSLTYPGFKILRAFGPTWFVTWSDSYELLQDKNVRVITNNYISDQQSKAINDLSAGLQDPTKVMIAAIKGPVNGQADPGTKTVVVLGLDTAKDIVTINDPTQATGQGLEMKLEDFTKAWGPQNFQLTTVQKAASSSTPLPEPATKLVWNLPAINEIGQALQDGLTNIATLVVHQIEGLQSNIGLLAQDLSYTFGLSSPDITPPASDSVEYGNYTKNLPYYYYQGKYDSCVLMATAAIIGQLNGGPVPPGLGEQIINQAEITPSEVRPDEVMFYKNRQEGDTVHWGTYYVDAVKLFNMNGVNADLTNYTSTQGDLALEALNNALSDGQGVMVAVNNDVLYTAYTRKYFGQQRSNPGQDPQSNHAVVVISVDMTKKAVYLNDSALQNGQGFPLPLDEFMRAWRASKYLLVTAELKK